MVRVANAKPLFDRLMSTLDGSTNEKEASSPYASGKLKFFSGNLSSLIAAIDIREVRARRTTNSKMMLEQLVFLW